MILNVLIWIDFRILRCRWRWFCDWTWNHQIVRDVRTERLDRLFDEDIS